MNLTPVAFAVYSQFGRMKRRPAAPDILAQLGLLRTLRGKR